MNHENLNRLLERIGDVNAKRRDLPLVTLEEFFAGNDDAGSIWCNVMCAPEPDEVFERLKSIRDREDVADVRIMVTQYDGGREEWPFSDTIFFVTSASEGDVRAWLGDEYQPNEVWVDEFKRAERIDVPEGMAAIAAWWD
ncbi:MAG: hypothetical protein R3B98_09415 [Hyphomonas sp.]